MIDRSEGSRETRFHLIRSLALVCTIAVCAPMVFSQNGQKPDPRASRGLVRNLPEAFQGYTIVSAIRSTSTYLVDMKGEVVHSWKGGYTPTFGIYLLDNGNLLRAGNDPNNFYYREGGQGGIVQEISWDGAIVWEYRYSDRHHAQHHDIEPLPNGNTLVCDGRRGRIFEVTPQGKIVWNYLNPITEEASSSIPPWVTSSNPMAPRQIRPYGLLRASRVSPSHPGLKRLAR